MLCPSGQGLFRTKSFLFTIILNIARFRGIQHPAMDVSSMNTPFSFKLLSLVLVVSLGGCASQSELAALRVDPNNPQYHSQGCQSSIAGGTVHRDIKSVTMVATPVLLVLSGGLLLPVLAANAGLDAVDRIDASNMVTRCGGRGETAGEIAGSVATGAVLGTATGLAPK